MGSLHCELGVATTAPPRKSICPILKHPSSHSSQLSALVAGPRSVLFSLQWGLLSPLPTHPQGLQSLECLPSPKQETQEGRGTAWKNILPSSVSLSSRIHSLKKKRALCSPTWSPQAGGRTPTSEPGVGAELGQRKS